MAEELWDEHLNELYEREYDDPPPDAPLEYVDQTDRYVSERPLPADWAPNLVEAPPVPYEYSQEAGLMSMHTQIGSIPFNPTVANPGALPALVGTAANLTRSVVTGGALRTGLRWLGIGGAAAAGGAAMEALVTPDGQVIETRFKKRRRRRRMLTCSDKADIAFLRGTLGGGEMGRSAISAVLSRRCS